MKITYLGTGAAEGVPALFCNCDYCKKVRKFGGKEVRSRSQVLFDDELCIDFPPDSFYHGVKYGVDFSKVKYLLATHSHMDHFYAHDFILRGYKYAKDMACPVLEIYANQECCEVFFESVRREIRKEIEESIRLHPISAFEQFSCGEWSIHTLKARHTSQNPLLFVLEKNGKRVLHLHDTGLPEEENYSYLAKIGGNAFDLISFDCTFLFNPSSVHGRHMNLEENMKVLARLKEMGLANERTKCVITHFSHNNEPSEEMLKRAYEQYGVIGAYDGLTVEI